MIKEKAKHFAKEPNIPDEALTFSDGWLNSFKNKNQIKRRTIYGESGSVNQTIIGSALPELIETIEKYDPNDVFNFDESSLFYRLEPDKALVSETRGSKKRAKKE